MVLPELEEKQHLGGVGPSQTLGTFTLDYKKFLSCGWNE